MARSAFFFVCVALMMQDFSNCCDYNEMETGCRLERNPGSPSGMECLCGIGCQREFPYENLAKCEADLKSGAALDQDPCKPNPCKNRGECMQLKFGRFRCECTGTNFFGENCEKPCPEQMGTNAFGYKDTGFPLECISI